MSEKNITVGDIISCIEEFAPPAYQESWDNTGLQVGNVADRIDSALITFDVTEAIVDDAIDGGEKLIISHHPLIFNGIKKLTGNSDTERSVMKAISNGISIYSAHTSIDSAHNGVSWRMAQKLGMTNISVLSPQEGMLKKFVVFVPESHAETVRDAIFEAGAGQIGNYGSCSFNIQGNGTFKAGSNARPYVGELGELHSEPEVRIETVVPSFLCNKVVAAMLKVHPYEEVAYDIYPLEIKHPNVGLGVVGMLAKPCSYGEFLNNVKTAFRCEVIRHSRPATEIISKVALCGGAGMSEFGNALSSKADAFITADVKYHQFFEAEGKLLLADIGHYESEQFTKELFFEIVRNKFSKFALRLSDKRTNPVNYLF